MTVQDAELPGAAGGSRRDHPEGLGPACPTAAGATGSDTSGSRPPADNRRGAWRIAAVVALVAAAVRLFAVTRAYDIFIDEITYSRIASNLAGGHGLTLYGQPFYLHPPAGFVLLALGVVVTGGGHGPIDQVVLHLRTVTALVGALSCATAYLLLRRAGTRRAALGAALLLAVDPFVVQYDSQVMLESLAQAGAVLTMALVAVGLTSSGPDVRRRALAGAGLAAAVTMCTKETFGLVVMGTLLVLWATGWVVTRREGRRMVATAFGGYLAVTVSAALVWGGIGPWWADKVHGVERLVGLAQDTGFNAPSTHVTLVSRITANLGQFGTTYLLLGLGGLATLALIRRLAPWRSDWIQFGPRPRVVLLVALWSFTACAYLGYAIAFGSLEEQMFYIMTLPVIANLCVWADLRAPAWRPQGRRLVLLALAALVVVDLGIWGSVHATRSDAYEQFLVWERAHIAPGQVVSVTEYTAQFMITNAVLGEWASLPEMRAHHVDYVLIVTNLVEQGYGLGTPATLRTLEAEAPLVFATNARGEGSLRLYDVRGLTGGSGR
jgi:4-amino-4-deoxy-L-arabinose transferase-like glycosyltransferase